MRRVLSVMLMVLVSCTGAQEPTTTGTTDGGEGSVVMENVAFRPDEITVTAGSAVTWTNQDLIAHTTTSDDNLWDSDPMGQGESFTFTFEEPGTYTYICIIHPTQMHGTVTVEG